MLLNYMGHSHPCSLCSLLLTFSSRFKWSFPFSESLSHSHILYVWNNLQTFHKVRVWGKIDMLAKLLTKLKHFVIFSIRRDKMIPFWKGWCSEQTRELLSITNVIPCIMGSIAWLWESFQLIGFEYQTFSTNSYVGSKMRENTLELRICGEGVTFTLRFQMDLLWHLMLLRDQMWLHLFGGCFFKSDRKICAQLRHTLHGQNYSCFSCPPRDTPYSQKLVLKEAAPLSTWIPFICSQFLLFSQTLN